MNPGKSKPLSAGDFRELTAVSRETLRRLQLYHDLLCRWQSTVNLVAPSTMLDSWRRHFLDSAQLVPLLPESTHIVVDLGTGAGFPGMVLAIIGGYDVHLIESDQRKVAFLREVAATTAATVAIHPTRITATAPVTADVVCARALAPLARLVDYAIPFLGAQSVCLFPKGRQVDAELAEAQTHWSMAVDRFVSRSDPSGLILRLSALTPR